MQDKSNFKFDDAFNRRFNVFIKQTKKGMDCVDQLHFNDAINLRNWIYRPRCLISEKEKNEYNLLFIQ